MGFMVGAGPLSPPLGQPPRSVLVVSDVGGLCQPPAQGSRHWSVQLSPESGRGTLLQVQGRPADKPPAGLGSITPAMGAGSCIWRGEYRLRFSTAQVSVDSGGRGRWPASPELRRSVRATFRRAAGRLGGHPGSSTLSCLGHVLATDMCYRSGGCPGLACKHRGCHWAEGRALSSSGGVSGRVRARVVPDLLGAARGHSRVRWPQLGRL